MHNIDMIVVCRLITLFNCIEEKLIISYTCIISAKMALIITDKKYSGMLELSDPKGVRGRVYRSSLGGFIAFINFMRALL